MLKFIYIFFLLFALGTGSFLPAHAQAEKTKDRAKSFPKLFIKVNPLSAAFSTINLKIEYHITPKIAAQLGGFYSLYGFKSRTEIYEYDIKSIEPQIRYYIIPGPDKIAPGGLFAAIYMRYSNFDLRETSYTIFPVDRFVTFTRIGGGVLGGYKLTLKKRISIEGFVGGGFYNQENKGRNHISLGEFRGGFEEEFPLVVGGTFGIAF